MKFFLMSFVCECSTVPRRRCFKRIRKAPSGNYGERGEYIPVARAGAAVYGNERRRNVDGAYLRVSF
ncbi:hypothetical protein KCP78_08595 [Salmonella enterica subsp. enterica]|nr:hypothetical protein KCP78_08595 [Salmonella enterica subsp. enterica]